MSPLKDQIKMARWLCFFAHYDQDDIIAEHVLVYLRELQKIGFSTVLITTSRISADQIEMARTLCVDVICRDNIGHDFGSWIAATTRFFPIKADLLLLANDSVYAPVGDLAAFVSTLVATPADAYGAVMSGAPALHLQSWFVLLRPAAYRSQGFTDLMCRPIQTFTSKWDLILSYEVGLTQALLREGLRVVAALDDRCLGRIAASTSFNFMHILWRQVIARGLPFLKVELMRANPVRATDIDQWRDTVEARNPALAEAIAADLARRGHMTVDPSTLLTWQQRMYWPEVRFLMKRGIERDNAQAIWRDWIDYGLFVAITTAFAPFHKIGRQLRQWCRR